MTTHNGTTRNGSAGGDYEIGRSKPPKRTQFEKGKSGNRRGRPPGVRNHATEVQRALRTRVELADGRRVRTVTVQEAMLTVLAQQTLAGDARARDRLLEQSARFNNQPSAAKKGPLPEEDQAILDAYVAEVRFGRAVKK